MVGEMTRVVKLLGETGGGRRAAEAVIRELKSAGSNQSRDEGN